MKANELRIGNYVLADGMILLQVDAVGIKPIPHITAADQNWNIEFMKPVPLDEEWLLKFGFEIIKWNALVSTQYYLPIPDSDKNISFLVRGRKLDTGSVIRLPHEHGTVYFDLKIEYVHQLQNLYFALTGDELTTKEK